MSAAENIVEIPQGKLRGKKDETVFGVEFYCFHKIPYAKPPIGDLRFKAPQPAEGWEDIRDATEEGCICPSVDFQSGKKYQDGCDEDSLFINIFCKHNPSNTGGKKYPVFVFIHPGGFECGSGSRAFGGPDYFLMHDVIFVTLNYRLGAFGFLSLQTVECPGNFGLKDQQLALKWVKNNISYFGGDPDNVTILGSSAGAASVHFHILNLSNKDLFKRAIALSGTAYSKWSISRTPRENAFVLGKRLGCDTQEDEVLLDFLRKASAEDIAVNSHGLLSETEGLSVGDLNLTFAPTVEPEHEGAYITKHPWKMDGEQLDVPLITGLCSQEMIFSLTSSGKIPELKTVEDFQGLIPKDIQLDSEGGLALAKRLKEFYFKNGFELESYLNVLSDIYMNYGAYKTVKTRKNCTSPTYLYLFTYKGDHDFFKQLDKLHNTKGTSHGEDLFYLFHTMFTNIENMKPGSRDHNFMLNLTKLFVSYATNGVPTPEGVEWTRTSPEGLEYLDLGEQFSMKDGLMRERMLFWDEIYTSNYEH